VDKSREEFLAFLHRNHQREEIDGQESVGRISKIPPAVRSAREARRLKLHPEFKLRRLWTIGSSHRYPSAVGLTRSCTKELNERRKVLMRRLILAFEIGSHKDEEEFS
jgi:hypothetical protein